MRLATDAAVAQRVARNLKALRRRACLIQATVAEHLAINRSRYNHWETGLSQPSVRFLLTLCAFYDVTLDQLLTTDLTKKR